MLKKERNDDCMVVTGSGNLKGRKKRDNLKPHGEGRWKKNPGERDGPTGRKSGAQRKTGLVDERQLQPYAPHGAKRNKQLTKLVIDVLNVTVYDLNTSVFFSD